MVGDETVTGCVETLIFSVIVLLNVSHDLIPRLGLFHECCALISVHLKQCINFNMLGLETLSTSTLSHAPWESSSCNDNVT